jgi:hypothetical protein
MKNDAWSAVARQPAAIWNQLPALAGLVALRLVAALDCHDGPVPGELDALVGIAMCGTVAGRERKNLRAALQKARDAGLIFEHEGQVYVLYSETLWRRYRALGKQVAQAAHAVPAPVAPPPPPPPPPVAPEQVAVVATPPANTNAVAESVASPSRVKAARLRLVGKSPAGRQSGRQSANGRPTVGQYSCTQLELSAGNHSGQVLGERERERETDTACPVPAAPAPVASLAKVRTRKQTEADVLRDRVVEIFNQEYQPLHHIRAVPGRGDYALLALTTQSYCPEGALDEALVRKSVRAYLNDPSWRNFGGYNLRSWATHHARGLTREEPSRGFFVNV